MRKVNCIYVADGNKCSVKPRVFFGLFRPKCTKLGDNTDEDCELAVMTGWSPHHLPTPVPRPSPVPAPMRIAGDMLPVICETCFSCHSDRYKYCPHCGAEVIK